MRILDLEIALAQGLPPSSGDVAFASTDGHGTIGDLGRRVLKELGLDPKKHWPDRKQLSAGHAWVQIEKQQPVVFVVTVSDSPAETLEGNLNSAFTRYRNELAGRSLWIPLLGTGAAGLSDEASLEVTLRALARSRSSGERGPGQVFLSVAPGISEEHFEQLAHLADKLAGELAETPTAPEGQPGPDLEQWSPEALEVLAAANGIRAALGQGRIHMEHLVYALHALQSVESFRNLGGEVAL